MATLNKIDVPVGVNHNSKLDLSSTHITSSGFMQLQPCYYYHCIPGTRIQGNINVLSRLAPLQLPTYGRCRINMRYWWIPYRTVMPNWNDFISDTIASDISSSSLVSGTPSIDNLSFVNLFLGTTGGTAAIPLSIALPNWQTGDPYDFNTSGVHYILTYQGRKYMKILHSLGYRFTYDVKDNTVYSALGILCFAKVYLDWYTNQQYHNSADYLYIQRLFKFVDPTSSLQLTTTDLNNILWFIQTVCYDAGNDVYVNAWDNPMAPNNGNFSSHKFQDVSLYTIGTGVNTQTNVEVVTDPYNGTPYMSQYNATVTNVGTEYLHSTLKAFTDYVKRNALSGADAADRLLSRFGLKLDNAALNRSTYIGESSADVDFGSVMQTVNNAGSGQPSNLGDYAGQGLGRGNGSFDFKCDEFGMFMITYSIVPAASLWQGFDPNNLHLDKLSFWHPEFDNLGCSAIPRGAVYVSKDDTFYNGTTTINTLSTFGFAPRFYEYKQKSSFVTGDIESAVMVGGDAWHLNRMFDDSSFNGIVDNVVHSFDFTRGVDAGTYNRIFNYTGDDIDNFYLVFHIAAQGIAPCRSLFDTYDFDDAGDKLKLSSQGAKVN